MNEIVKITVNDFGVYLFTNSNRVKIILQCILYVRLNRINILTTMENAYNIPPSRANS